MFFAKIWHKVHFMNSTTAIFDFITLEDGMYVLRQMVEKRLEVQGSMALGFVDLEKVFGTVPREMVMATLRWMGIPEAEVRMVEGTYEKTTARVLVAEGDSEEFEV